MSLKDEYIQAQKQFAFLNVSLTKLDNEVEEALSIEQKKLVNDIQTIRTKYTNFRNAEHSLKKKMAFTVEENREINARNVRYDEEYKAGMFKVNKAKQEIKQAIKAIKTKFGPMEKQLDSVAMNKWLKANKVKTRVKPSKLSKYGKEGKTIISKGARKVGEAWKSIPGKGSILGVTAILGAAIALATYRRYMQLEKERHTRVMNQIRNNQ